MTVPRLSLARGAETRLVLSDRDVTLAMAVETTTSAFNTLRDTVAGVEPLPDETTARVRISIAGTGEMLVLVTRRSVVALGLAEGLPVLARFRLTAVQ